MYKRLQQFNEHSKRSKKIFIFFSLNLIFLILSLIVAILQFKNFLPYLIILIAVNIVLLSHTAAFCFKNLILVKNLEEYIFKKNYGISEFKIQQFHKLLDENLLHYYFQPIINAKTGEIFAYEALMRTDISGMVPMEILDLAATEHRLYDIEKLTFYNTLEIMNKFSEVFKTRKLFINSISGYQLTDEDFQNLMQNYKELLPHIVIEIQNDSSLKQSTLELIKSRVTDMNCKLALDEYGIGLPDNSCIYQINPDFLKIDRTLLRYINIDLKKQNIVSNLINYAKQNNIKIIAEGIESYDELEYLINQGVDYLQGFYAAKPNPEIASFIGDDLLHKIQKINYKKLSDITNTTMFETHGETELIPSEISSDHYCSIVIFEKEILLKGKSDEKVELNLIIPDNHSCLITLENLTLSSNERPCLIIGKYCDVTIKLVGDNFFYKDGIRVPESSNLIIQGDGNLTIHSDHSTKIGIGGSDSQTYGNITLASSGNIKVQCSGSISVGIGGGQNTANSLIRLLSGKISVETSGFTTVAIGNILGNALVVIENCELSVRTEGTKSIGIGSILGMVKITTCGDLKMNCTGRNAVAIGTLEEGYGDITITGGNIINYFNTYYGTGIGSASGTINVKLLNGDVMIHGEGTDIVAIGDHSGSGEFLINNGVISIQLYTSNSLINGYLPQKIIIDGGNIQCDFPDNITPVNSYGTPLVAHIITDTDEFTQVIETVSYRYVYKASYSPRFPFIKVYLPENMVVENSTV